MIEYPVETKRFLDITSIRLADKNLIGRAIHLDDVVAVQLLLALHKWTAAHEHFYAFGTCHC